MRSRITHQDIFHSKARHEVLLSKVSDLEMSHIRYRLHYLSIGTRTIRFRNYCGVFPAWRDLERGSLARIRCRCGLGDNDRWNIGKQGSNDARDRRPPNASGSVGDALFPFGGPKQIGSQYGEVSGTEIHILQP